MKNAAVKCAAVQSAAVESAAVESAAVKNVDVLAHATGASRFLDDQAEPRDLLHAAVFASPIPHGRLLALDTSAALRAPGVRAVLTAEHIPGDNQIGNAIKDEPLLADGVVQFVGQPIAVVVAESPQQARDARDAIVASFERLPAVFDPREAHRQGLFIQPPLHASMGDVDAAWARCALVVEGRVDSGGQEHLYLETQRAIAYPAEHGGVRVEASTQSPMTAQRAIADVLGLSMRQVQVDVRRLGGGFGGKINQCKAWAALAALACVKTGHPVKLRLRRDEDMALTGKRHPYSSDFKLGLDGEGRILAYEVSYFQNSGAAADSSPVVAAVTLFGLSCSYFIPNVRAVVHLCRTNLVPNTACRGFGKPEGMFVLEAALFQAASVMDVPVERLQETNLLRDGDRVHYGPQVSDCTARRCWGEAWTQLGVEALARRIFVFNEGSAWVKKGFALTPVRYGVSFDAPMLNQGSALLHVYLDGSVSLTTGAVEMGQGVGMKLRQIVSRALCVRLDRVEVRGPSTAQVANTSPTAASFSTDLNGHAARLACEAILERLKRLVAGEQEASEHQGLAPEAVELRDERVCVGGRPTELSWVALVQRAYRARVSLSEHAHYRPEGLTSGDGGDPFQYYVYGTAVTEVTLDALRGTYRVDAVRVIHDVGEPLNAEIDRGQAEGAIVQGVGWMTSEELVMGPDGALLSDGLDSYKAPTICTAPGLLDVRFLEEPGASAGIYRSKGTGEAPIIYGFGAYFALLKAIRAFTGGGALRFTAPLTPERALMMLYAEATRGEDR